MRFSENIVFDELIGHKTLLYGELRTKKTYCTAKFVQFLIEAKEMPPSDISILDFAPEKQIFPIGEVGGKIEDFYENAKYCKIIPIKGKILPPRLSANNIKHLIKIATENYEKLGMALNLFYQNPTPFLIINDLSMFLHKGSKKYLWNIIQKASTFFGNAYYGDSIQKDFTRKFNIHEKNKVDFLIKRVDFSYKTK